MTLLDDEHAGLDTLYLRRSEVIDCFKDIDVVDIVRQTLISHANNGTSLPEEAYLGWQTPNGFAARSLAMPGAVSTPRGQAIGLKVINGSLANTEAGLPRSQGFTMLFDVRSARTMLLAEAAYISAMRTAALTIATAARLARKDAKSVALIGCGTLAKAHLELLRGSAGITEVRLFDRDSKRAHKLARAVQATEPAYDLVVAGDVKECVSGADVVVPVTTTTVGYIEPAWLAPGCLVAHVSLDDLLPAVVVEADLLVVDDWDLISQDDRRLLGRMYREGVIAGPAGEKWDESREPVRKVDASLGEIFDGTHPGRTSDQDIIVSNPFGMAILDVAVAAEVYAVALARGTGIRLPV